MRYGSNSSNSPSQTEERPQVNPIGRREFFSFLLASRCLSPSSLRPERKRLQIVNAPKKSARAKLLKLADKISNLNSMADSPPAHWPAQRRMDYVAWAKQVVSALGSGIEPGLQERFSIAAARAEQAARSN
jgi:hypothetical protein